MEKMFYLAFKWSTFGGLYSMVDVESDFLDIQTLILLYM